VQYSERRANLETECALLSLGGAANLPTEVRFRKTLGYYN
jgi:hypothetical protein